MWSNLQANQQQQQQNAAPSFQGPMANMPGLGGDQGYGLTGGLGQGQGGLGMQAFLAPAAQQTHPGPVANSAMTPHQYQNFGRQNTFTMAPNALGPAFGGSLTAMMSKEVNTDSRTTTAVNSPVTERSMSPEVQRQDHSSNTVPPGMALLRDAALAGVTDNQARMASAHTPAPPGPAPNSPERMRAQPFMQPPSNLRSQETSHVPPAAPAGAPEQASVSVQDTFQQLFDKAIGQTQFLHQNASLVTALTNFCPELVPAMLQVIADQSDDHLRVLLELQARGLVRDVRLDRAEGLLASMMESVKALESSVATLNAPTASTSTSAKPKGKPKAPKAKSNDHPLLKAKVHELFWKLLGVDDKSTKGKAAKSLSQKLAELPEPIDGFLGMVEKDRVTTWYAAWGKAVNTWVNVDFLNYLAERIMDNEKRARDAKQGVLPDASYNLEVVHQVAKGFFQYVLKEWNNRQMEEGVEKYLAAQMYSRQRQRHITRAGHRRESVLIFDEKFGTEGADVYVVTDLGSDFISLSEDDTKILDAILKARDDQKVGDEAWMVAQPPYRRKLYVIFLQVLDFITYIRKSGQVKEFLREEEDGPALKKRRTETRSKNTRGSFEAPPTVRSTRKLGNVGRDGAIPPRCGMFCRSFLETTDVPLDVDEDLDWWKTWKNKVDVDKFLSLGSKIALEGLEDDSEDEAL